MDPLLPSDEDDDFYDLYAGLDDLNPPAVDSDSNRIVGSGSENDDDDDIRIVLNREPFEVDGDGRGKDNIGSPEETNHRNVRAVASQSTDSLSLPGRYDRISRDLDFLTVSCSMVDTNSNPGRHVVGRHETDFFLPRNKTIFDVNIEALECKRWRIHGADITDFFNFDLDEESWKHYCKLSANYRLQTALAAKFPERKFIAEKQVTGMSIDVESGIHERRPSIDTRRARTQDSDVVIHIKLQDSVEDVHVQGDKEMECSGSSSLQSRNSIADIVQSVFHSHRDETNHVEHDPKSSTYTLNDASQQPQSQPQSTMNDGRTVATDTVVLVPEVISTNHISCKSSHYENEFGSHESGVSMEKRSLRNKPLGPRRNGFQDSVISNAYVCKDRGSANSSSLYDTEDSSSGHDNSPRKWKKGCPVKANNSSAVKKHKDEAYCSSKDVHGKDHENLNILRICDESMRHSQDSGKRASLSLEKENKVQFKRRSSRSIRSRDIGGTDIQNPNGKLESGGSCTGRKSTKQCHSHEQREIHGTDCSKKVGRFFLERRNVTTARSICAMEADTRSRRRSLSDWDKRVALPKEKRNSLSLHEDPNFQQRGNLKNDCDSMEEFQYWDTIHCKHAEASPHETHRRNVSYPARKENLIEDAFNDRDRPKTYRSSKIEKNRNLTHCYDSDDSVDFKHGRHSVWKSLAFQADKENYIRKERESCLFDEETLIYNSEPSRELLFEPWSSVKNRTLKRTTSGNLRSRGGKYCHSLTDVGLVFQESGDYFAEHVDSFHSEDNMQLLQSYQLDDETSFRCQEYANYYVSPQASFLSEGNAMHFDKCIYNLNQNEFLDSFDEDGSYFEREHHESLRVAKPGRRQSSCWDEKSLRGDVEFASNWRKINAARKMSTLRGNLSYAGISEVHRQVPAGNKKRKKNKKINESAAESNVSSARLHSSVLSPKHDHIEEHNSSEPEEGELIEGQERSDGGKALLADDVASTPKVVGNCDNSRILEILARMERRRERFKELGPVGKDPEKTQQPPSLIVPEVDVVKQRPLRKRRWTG